MRLEWLLSTGLLVVAIGCAGSGGDSVPATSDGDNSAAPSLSSQSVNSETDQTATSTSWDLLDDTVLKVSVAPPLSAETKLQVTRRYDIEVHGALESLWYRVVTDATPDAEWVLLPRWSNEEVGDSMEENTYETSLTLPKGTSSIQFKIDQGFGEPYELKGWKVQVE
jgi:hypothetical protein